MHRWLAKTSNIDPKIPVRDWRLTPASANCRSALGSAALLETIGLGAVAHRLESRVSAGGGKAQS
jgi:hypothetical protein